ncbi:E3 SUMO-protein ligase ZBED1-like [Rhipicephalus sanguineus]|uniref:E3 SUMO-protein ligase ZBED1-like n=1 Tax=Rhipicephalus sanguineus TaxID=34632 RepID=UPI001895D86D|nr:E3 SUMO-protein ligase ZBED1-like [Rhipicephalus sanguineus]
MMARLLKLRRPISLDLSEQDTMEDFTSTEWRLMTSMTSVLKCIDDATRESCSEKHPTLSQVVPLNDEEEPSVSSASAEAASPSSDVWSVFGTLAGSNTAPTGSERLKKEVEEYLHAPVQPRLDNHFLWWKNIGKAKYSSLYNIARLYLSVPATQVSSERLFSTTGNVVTARREHLLPEHVEQLVFVHSNMR